MAEGTTEIATGTAAGPREPYPGLRPFREDEASIFFGRERHSDRLAELLEDRNVLLVHGGSGCGKSSIVLAGLLPMLKREHRRAGLVFANATFRPSWGPYEALAKALADTIMAPAEAGDAYNYWGKALLDDDTIVAAIERQMTDAKVDTLCLIVDQFEEIFPWIRDRRSSDVERLVHFLAAVERTKSTRLFVLVTMRSDFIGHCARFPELTAIINACQYFLPGLTAQDAARAIVEPAKMFGGSIKPDLLHRMLLVASSGTDSLPIIQHALKRMADRRPRETAKWELSDNDFRAAGGSSTPLSQHADEIAQEIIDRFGAPGRDALEVVFRSLFDVEKSGEAIRRPRDFEQLVAVVDQQVPDRAKLVNAIVAAFSRDGVNMLVTSPDRNDPDRRRIDISHEALLRQWTRIAGHPDQPGDSWKQREVNDGLMWRNLTSKLRAQDPMSESLKSSLVFFSRMEQAPERARRYLSTQTSIEDVTKSGEWQQVRHLLDQNVKRQRIRQIAMAMVTVLVVAGLSIVGYLATARKGWQEAGTAINTESVGSATTATEGIDERTAEILNTVNNTAFDRSGYIWLGDSGGENLTLRRMKTPERVAVADIVPGECYTPLYAIALRTGLPDPLNRSAPRKMGVQSGQLVCALDKPDKHEPSGQWWLRVATAKIYIHASGGPSPGLTKAAQDLRDNNYLVAAIQQIRMTPGLVSVRHCNEQDASVAKSLADYMSSQFPSQKFTADFYGDYPGCAKVSPGILEIWIDTAHIPDSTRQRKRAV